MCKDLVDIKSFGDIKKLRISKNKSQAEVAKHCGVSVQTVYIWETGSTKKISRIYADKLCDILGVSVDYE